MAEVIDEVQSMAHNQAQAYRQGEQRPLAGYVLVMAVFGALVAGAVGLAKASGRRLPNVGPFDLVLLALGTHKLSRIISKDAVTSRCARRSPSTRSRAAPPRSWRRRARPARSGTPSAS